MDLQMPEMDGEQTARAIQSEAGLANVPIVLLSSAGSRGSAGEIRDNGFAAALTKPVRQSHLFHTLVEVLGLSGSPPTPPSRENVAPQEAPLPFALRILLVEDSAINQKVALRMLARWGCRADVAANGQEALDALACLPYDLVLMDMQMPEMDGFGATAEIRRQEAGTGRHLPIIAMTAHSMEGDRERCLAAGMDDYLAKPVQPAALRAILKRWGKSSAESQAAAPPARRQRKSGLPVMRWEHLRAMCDGEVEEETELLHDFLMSAASLLAEIHAAAASANARALEQKAHALKGSCRTLGAEALAAACLALEQVGRTGGMAEVKALGEHAECEYVRLRIALEANLQERAA
jgi:two-component system sensor histidine kinase/response regulator